MTTSLTGVNKMDLKFKLSNLPKYISPERVQGAAAEILGISRDNVVARKRSHSDIAFVSVRPGNGSVSSLLGRLNSSKIEGSQIIAIEDQQSGNKRIKLKMPDKKKCLADQVTCLWRIPYEEQLLLKHSELSKALNTVHRYSSFDLTAVKPSPLIYGYRNKAEFTFGVDRQGKVTIGLCLGGFLDGFMAVESPKDCLHIPRIFIALVDYVQSFIDEHQHLKPWNCISKGGFWRILLVRVHGNDQLLVGLQVTENHEYQEDLNEFIDYLKAFKHESINIASLHLQQSSVGHSGLDMKVGFKCVFGDEYVMEIINSLKFKVSPLSFFQNNIPATIVLYDTIKQLALTDNEEPGILLDLCCGTGTIGLYMAEFFEKVIGIELVPEAVEDAKKNAEINNLSSKVEFICSKVEEVIDSVISQNTNKMMTVVLDPPRAGCHASVIKAVRKCQHIKRVVFVACDAAASSTNILDLVREETDKLPGEPFKITTATPVDLFPHTPHVELVVQLIR